MTSFNDALDRIKELLQTDSDLQALISAEFSRELTIRRAYKNREEIQLDELPVILLTRPEVDGDVDSVVAGTRRHTVGMYCGFHCEEREMGQELLVRFEEAIDRAIMRDMTLSHLVDFVSPGPSRNDEGKNHPTYFIVKTFVVSQEVSWP